MQKQQQLTTKKEAREGPTKNKQHTCMGARAPQPFCTTPPTDERAPLSFAPLF
jgi:hypothetical protein